MALIATTFTVETILLIIGIYLFDGGLIRQLGAIGLFADDISLTVASQKYVSDLSSPPANISLFFTPEIQTAWVIMLAVLTLIAMSFFFLSVFRIMLFLRHGGKMTWTMAMEELV